MPATYTEKELVFTFPDETNWMELDEQGKQLPIGMALVDLVIERDADCLLVEIKDPSHTKSPEKEQKKYLKRLRDDSVLKNELTPKARDSYTYQHLMKRDAKPFVYVVLLGLDAFSNEIQRGVLNNFSDRLYGSLRNESHEPWKRTHVTQCLVMSIDAWNDRFTKWPVKRVPAQN